MKQPQVLIKTSANIILAKLKKLLEDTHTHLQFLVSHQKDKY